MAPGILHQSGGATIDGATYTLDNAGNRTSKLNWQNGITENYTYDPIYELTQVQQVVSGNQNTTESYSYDAVGNRLSSLNVSSYSYNNSNELTSSSDGYAYTYDYNGNTLTKSNSSGTMQYNWDFENRLTMVILPNGEGSVGFKYDPLGRRIQKSSATSNLNYLYDDTDNIDELDSSGNVTAKYTHEKRIDSVLSMLRGSSTSFYEQDGTGSVTSISNAAMAISQTYTFAGFGTLAASMGSVSNPFQYTGREFDSETSMNYYRARYYDSTVGRFVTEDPIRFRANPSNPNFYTYVENDPIIRTDPTGLIHQAWDEIPYDGRLHNDAAGGLEVLCTKGRNIRQDIGWLEHSIFVRTAEIENMGEDADAGHITRLDDEIATLERCQEECEKNNKPDPLPEEQHFWERIFNPKNLIHNMSSGH